MITDVEFFITKLSKIDGFGDAGGVLTDIAKSKEVKASEPSPEASEEEKPKEDGESDESSESAKSSGKEPDGEETKAEA